MKKRNEIRIVDPAKEIWNAINKMATIEKRTIGKQAEYMLGLYIHEQKTKKK